MGRALDELGMVGVVMNTTVLDQAQLITRGIPSRYPNVKIVNSHLGGALPMLLQRADDQYTWEYPDTPERPSAAARRMWYDIFVRAVDYISASGIPADQAEAILASNAMKLLGIG
jgi:hypothetical protein